MTDTDSLIRLNEVGRITGAKRATIYKWMALGTFPKQVPISPSAVGWLESEVRAWLKARVAERDAKEAHHVAMAS